MATYYKYAERNAGDQVDWSAIGSSISKTLLDERDRREAAKEKIEQASNAYAETLANAPMGESKNINDFTLDFADNAQQYRLMQDRMLRDGRMKLKDYNVGRQNLKSGTQQLFDLSKEYNSVYSEKMKRLQDGESQEFESWAMGNIEGYANFSNAGAYIDPTSGNIALAKKVKNTLPDGTIVYEMSKNPNDFMSVSQLKNTINLKYNKFNVDENLKKGVDSFGNTIKVIMSGGVKTRESAMQNPDFTKAKNSYIESLLSPDNTMSILTDSLGKVVNEDGTEGDDFRFSYDPEEAAKSENIILIKNNQDTGRPEADFSTANGTKQREMAVKYLDTRLNSMLDLEETAMQQFAPKTPSDGSSKEVRIGYFKDLDKIITGNEQVAEAAIRDRIEDVNRYNVSKKIQSKITSFDRDFVNKKFTIIFEEPEGRRTEVIDIAGKDTETIAQEISRYLTPQISSFSAALKDFEKSEGGFTSLEGLKNPVSFSRSIGFTDKPEVSLNEILFDKNDSKSKTLYDKFTNLSSSMNNFEEAAPLVLRSLTNALSDITKDIKVEAIDESGSTNTIKATIEGKTYDIKYDDDNAKLISDVQSTINKIINEYNVKGRGGSTETRTTEVKFDEFGVPIIE